MMMLVQQFHGQKEYRMQGSQNKVTLLGHKMGPEMRVPWLSHKLGSQKAHDA